MMSAAAMHIRSRDGLARSAFLLKRLPRYFLLVLFLRAGPHAMLEFQHYEPTNVHEVGHVHLSC